MEEQDDVFGGAMTIGSETTEAEKEFEKVRFISLGSEIRVSRVQKIDTYLANPLLRLYAAFISWWTSVKHLFLY